MKEDNRIEEGLREAVDFLIHDSLEGEPCSDCNDSVCVQARRAREGISSLAAAFREARAENERLREALDRARRDFNLLSTRLTMAGLNNAGLSIDNAVARIEAALAVSDTPEQNETVHPRD